jgi:Radical SAM superfamily
MPHAIFLSACVPPGQTLNIRPLGVYQIAWYLREHGYDIQVIDFIHKFKKEVLLELIEQFITEETKIIGLGMMVDTQMPALEILKMHLAYVFVSLKKKYPHIKFIIGGANGYFWSRFFKNGSLFDYYVRGYAEDQCLQLFNHVFKNGPRPAFEVLDGNKHLNEDLVPNREFDFSTASHKWHIKDCIQPGEPLPIEFARGCIFACNFCRYPHIGKHINDYTRILESIREELIYNYDNFKTTSYYVTDDTFNADKDFVRAFTDMVKTLPFKLNYGAYLRADLLHGNQDTLEMFLENGLVSTYFGIESINLDSAKLFGKPWSGKHARDFLPKLYHDLWQKKVNITVGLIAGTPFENLEDLKNTNRWVKETGIPSALWHPLVILRGPSFHKSEFDLNAENYGYKFKLVEGQSIWYLDNCDWFKALEWKDELQNDLKPHNKIAWVDTIAWNTIGMGPTETRDLVTSKVNYTEVVNKSTEFFQRYVNDLRKLTV